MSLLNLTSFSALIQVTVILTAVQVFPWQWLAETDAQACVTSKCHFFMWLVAHNECWTADCLARRGLQHHQKCLLCDQDSGRGNHLVSCVFSRQFWFELLQKFGQQILAPQPAEPSFEVWWSWSNEFVADQDRQGLNSLIFLGALSLWIHRNRCVFDGASPTLHGILASVH